MNNYQYLEFALNITSDAIGRPIQMTDPLGNVSQSSVDMLDRVTQTVDALGRTTVIGYDPDGNLTQMKDANDHIHAYAFDVRNNPAGYTDPLAQSETY